MLLFHEKICKHLLIMGNNKCIFICPTINNKDKSEHEVNFLNNVYRTERFQNRKNKRINCDMPKNCLNHYENSVFHKVIIFLV